MAGKREEKERLRRERLAAEAARSGSERRRLLLGYVVAGLLTAAVVAGLVAVILSSGNDENVNGFEACEEGHFQIAAGTPPDGAKADCRVGTAPPAIQVGDLQESAEAAGCELMEELPDEGNRHLEPGTAKPAYKTNPATSGDHIKPNLQASDGAYAGFVDPVLSVHSLEHGRIAYQYSPDLPSDQQLAIKGLFDEDADGTLLFPNPEMPYAVAATAWTQLVGCPKYTPGALDVLRNFRDTYRGNGPESEFPVSLG